MKRSRLMSSNNRGFTLVELIIVIAILGILVSIATPAIFSYIKTSQMNSDLATAKTIENAFKSALSANQKDYLDQSTGDINIAMLPNIRNDVLEKLGRSTYPALKQAGHNFYIFNNHLDNYRVISWDGTSAETGVGNQLSRLYDYTGTPVNGTNVVILTN